MWPWDHQQFTPRIFPINFHDFPCLGGKSYHCHADDRVDLDPARGPRGRQGPQPRLGRWFGSAATDVRSPMDLHCLAAKELDIIFLDQTSKHKHWKGRNACLTPKYHWYVFLDFRLASFPLFDLGWICYRYEIICFLLVVQFGCNNSMVSKKMPNN